MTIHVIAFLKRRSDITPEEFSKHWGEDHAALITSLQACKVHLVSYSQFLTVPALLEPFARLGLPTLPYDGAAEFEVEKVEDLFAILGDDEYQKTATPHEMKFLDRENMMIMVGELHRKYERK